MTDTWLVECKHCPGIITNNVYPQLLTEVAAHFHKYHPDHVPILIPTVDYERTKNVLMCDLCNARLGTHCWTHTLAEPIKPFDTDGRWAVCIDCHPLIIKRDLDALMERHVRVGDVQFPYIDQHSRDGGVQTWRECVRRFLPLAGPGTYEPAVKD